jgi:anti-anti-sigma factor
MSRILGRKKDPNDRSVLKQAATDLAAGLPDKWCGRSPMQGKSSGVSTETIGPTLVATITEPELTAPKVADLTSEMQELLNKASEVKNLVVDLQNVEYLDSACLYMLVHLLEQVRETGGQIAVARPQQRVEGVFKLTRLDNVFPIKSTVLEAIAAVEQAAAEE